MRAGLMILTAIVAVGFGEANAAPCIAPPLSPAAIEQFRANPEALVGPEADTRTVESQVRDLVGTDASLAADLVRLARTTTPRFRTAIAAGLAQAAVACQTVDQEAGLAIQQAVASFEEDGFQNAFAAVSGDLSTAATVAATNSATAAVGSVVIVNPGSGARVTTNPGGGGSTAFFSINSGGAVTATSATTTTQTSTTTSGGPVSATR